MIELVFATNNKNKLDEVRAIVDGRFFIKSLEDIGCYDDIPETGDTFEENAKQKSDYLFRHFQLDSFADDSGLEVESLKNEPGVYSARYSGTRNMEDNIDLLLEKLGDNANRKACFRTVISLYLNKEQHFFEGVIYGEITHERKGTEGFGYDPVFVPNGYNKTFAEMSATEKNDISHRAIATRKLGKYLLSL